MTRGCGYFAPHWKNQPLSEVLNWHPAFKGQPASALTYKTEIDAAAQHGYRPDQWTELDRETRAMLVGKVLIERAFQALQAYEAEQERKNRGHR